MVVTHINPETDPNPTKVVFQVRNSKDVYKILDVKIQGVSMIVTQRDEFTGFIRNNGGKVSALITALEKDRSAQNESEIGVFRDALLNGLAVCI